MITAKKAAMVIGHPGHELRAFKYIKEFKPDVFILTDGSGSVNEPRLYQSIRLIEANGARYMESFPAIPDREMYRMILENQTEKILAIKARLKSFILEAGYDCIVGDALEGFNPTHDLCRYLINGIITDIKEETGLSIRTYDFLLDEAPNNIPQSSNHQGISLELSPAEFDEKLEAANNYPELKYEVEYAINRFGREAFYWESFRKVNDLSEIRNWKGEEPYYETFGRKRIEEGLYSDLITFDHHLKPIALACIRSRN